MSDPTERALALLSLLQTHRFWSGAELSERLGVSDRTLRRDVDRLRGLGYPVDATAGASGGYRLAAGSHMPPLLLDDDEAVAIAVGLRSTATASIDGMGEISARAMVKLEQVLPDRLRRRVATLHAAITPLVWGGQSGGAGAGEGAANVDPEALATIAQGCRDHEQIRFEYRRRDGDERRRLVEPHHLVTAGRRWYLVAWDVRRDDWRTFRVDRLTDCRLAGARFEPKIVPGGDPAGFVGASIEAMPRAMELTATVALPAVEAEQRLGWTGATVEAGRFRTDGPPAAERMAASGTGDESCTVRIRGESVEWLVGSLSSVLLALGPEVSVDLIEGENTGAVREALTGHADHLSAL